MPSTITSTEDTSSAVRPEKARPNEVDLAGLQPVWDALLAAKADEERAARVAENMAEIIKDRLGDAEFGVLGGRRVVAYENSERVILRAKLVRQLHPVVALECEDIIPIRTFRVLNP